MADGGAGLGVGRGLEVVADGDALIERGMASAAEDGESPSSTMARSLSAFMSALAR